MLLWTGFVLGKTKRLLLNGDWSATWSRWTRYILLLIHFVTDELAEMMVGQINFYANQYIRDHIELSSRSLARSWKDVTSDE